MLLRRDVALNIGTAYYDFAGGTEVVGDRRVPSVMFFDAPGGRDSPRLHMRFEVRQGVPVCAELRVIAKDGGSEVQSKWLRLIRLEDWMETVVAGCSEHIDSPTQSSLRETTRDDVRNVRTARKQTRRTVTPELLAKVAEIYREHFYDNPVQVISAAFGVSVRTAARYVQHCRSDEYQLLPKTEPGKKKA